MRRRPGIRSWGGAVAAGLLLTGCSGTVLDADGVAVLVSERARSGMDALMTGPLAVVDGCLGAGDAVVIWPFGTSVVDEDPLTITIPDNGTFALGDEVSVGGGFVLESDTALRTSPLVVSGVPVPAACARGDVFLAR